jgi:syntaxin 1B/2/3
MQPLANNGAQQPYSAPRDPNAILNDCRAVGRAIDDLEARLSELQRLQRNFVSGTAGASNKDVDSLSADIMSGYRGLADRVKRIKSQPDARQQRNVAQVEALDRRIRKAINHYQQVESQFRKEVQEQQRRQYLIVRPDASESEIREATEAGGDTQIFQQALLNADRRGQAQSTLRNVQQRHDAIQQIERTMIELQQLFQDLDAIVVQQEEPIVEIERKAEETNTHLEAGNVHVGKAVNSARAARKKKWICLGICSKLGCELVVDGWLLTWSSYSCHHYHYRLDCGHLWRHSGLVQQQEQRQRQPLKTCPLETACRLLCSFNSMQSRRTMTASTVSTHSHHPDHGVLSLLFQICFFLPLRMTQIGENGSFHSGGVFSFRFLVLATN